MFLTNPQAIVWTESEPAYQQVDFRDYVSADIQSIQSWIAKEAELSAFRNLGNSWDGFDAPAPDSTLVERAISFLRVLRDRDRSNPPKRVVLSADGFIALEWVEGDRFIQAEIGDSNEVEWMVARPGQPTEFGAERLAVQSDSGPTEGQAWQPPATVVAEEPGRCEKIAFFSWNSF
jgi:hypothetical protein